MAQFDKVLESAAKPWEQCPAGGAQTTTEVWNTENRQDVAHGEYTGYQVDENEKGLPVKLWVQDQEVHDPSIVLHEFEMLSGQPGVNMLTKAMISESVHPRTGTPLSIKLQRHSLVDENGVTQRTGYVLVAFPEDPTQPSTNLTISNSGQPTQHRSTLNGEDWGFVAEPNAMPRPDLDVPELLEIFDQAIEAANRPS